MLQDEFTGFQPLLFHQFQKLSKTLSPATVLSLLKNIVITQDGQIKKRQRMICDIHLFRSGIKPCESQNSHLINYKFGQACSTIPNIIFFCLFVDE